jgi:hypothetical protein
VLSGYPPQKQIPITHDGGSNASPQVWINEQTNDAHERERNALHTPPTRRHDPIGGQQRPLTRARPNATKRVASRRLWLSSERAGTRRASDKAVSVNKPLMLLIDLSTRPILSDGDCFPEFLRERVAVSCATVQRTSYSARFGERGRIYARRAIDSRRGSCQVPANTTHAP